MRSDLQGRRAATRVIVRDRAANHPRGVHTYARMEAKMSGMATPTKHVARDGSESWRVRFRYGGRGSRASSKTFATFDGALIFSRLVDEHGADRALKILSTRRRGSTTTPTVRDWCTEHIDALSGVQADTIKRYQALVRNDLGTLAGLPVDAVTHEDVAAWVNAQARAINPRTGKPTSGKTIKNRHGFLSAAFARAEREPMAFLTHEEYTRFIGYFTPHWQPLVMTLFSTGLRWSEATALRVGDLDVDRGTVTVERAWKEGRVLGPPKSRKSRRTVALDRDAYTPDSLVLNNYGTKSGRRSLISCDTLPVSCVPASKWVD
jgi:integrase